MIGNRVEVTVQELLGSLVADALGTGCRAQLLLAKSWCPVAALAEGATRCCASSTSSWAPKITCL